MKRNYFLVLGFLMLAYLPAKAQAPEIDESSYSHIGDTFSLHMADTTTFNVGSAGADVTWDFRNITLTGDTTHIHVLDPANTPYGSEFGSPDIAIKEDSVYRYYQLNSGGFYNWGEGYTEGGIKIIFQHTVIEKVAEFPMEYQDTLRTNIFGYTTASGFSIERKGTTVVTADSYGRLILPGNRNYNDVMRIKVMRTYTDSLNPTGTTALYVDGWEEIYYWYSESEEGYLARFERIYEVERNSGTVSRKITTASVILEGEGQVGIAQPTASVNNLRIMPNPAKDRVNVKYNVEENQQVKITLYNLLGKRMMQETEMTTSGANQASLNVGNLPRGVYLLNIETGNAVSTQRVVLD